MYHPRDAGINEKNFKLFSISAACKNQRASEFFFSHGSQRPSIADGGAVEKPPPGNQSSIEKLKSKITTKS